jgi:hypothetical protein
MKQRIGNLLLAVISTVLTLGFCELVLRQILPTPPSYEGVIHRLLDRTERLFGANTSVRYDIKGLYERADTTELKVSRNRLIEPDSPGSHKYRVLFLGGSTTEALYVPQAQRWVALLNESGTVATFNAAQSGANTIDAYSNFLYLTGGGMRFDLVVLATAINDMGWLQHFRKHGRRFIAEEYKNGLYDYYVDQFGPPKAYEPRPVPSAIYRLAREAYGQLRQLLIGKPDRAETVLSAGNVTQTYLEMRKAALATFSDERRPAQTTLMDRYPGLDDAHRQYRANAAHNIGLLNQAVTRTGATLLVVSEASSWMAPSSSFYEDLRIPSGMSSFEDLHEFALLLNAAYLEAAREAGALTYDLAAEVNPYTNGADGGRYMYDNMHYTPDGCSLVASLTRSVLRRLLTERGDNGRSHAAVSSPR